MDINQINKIYIVLGKNNTNPAPEKKIKKKIKMEEKQEEERKKEREKGKILDVKTCLVPRLRRVFSSLLRS